MGAPSCPCNKGQLKGDDRKLKTQEQKKKAKDAKSIRGIVHENDRNKGASRANDRMGQLLRHDEQELLKSVGGLAVGRQQRGMA